MFQLLLEVTASGIVVEGGSGFVHFAVPHEAQIMFMRAPSLLGVEEMQAEHAVDVLYPAHDWEGFSLQTRGPCCAVPLQGSGPLPLTQLVIATENLSASFRPM